MKKRTEESQECVKLWYKKQIEKKRNRNVNKTQMNDQFLEENKEKHKNRKNKLKQDTYKQTLL